jgi:predicted amidohydrolase YtcJ
MVASAEDKAKDVKADVVYRNGFVYTVDGMAQVAEAFAVKDGKFVAVGSNDAMKAVTGKDTKVIHLKKKMVMPGLADSHIHALRGALTNLGVKFPFSATPEEAAAATAKFIADNKIKKGEWVVGGTWAFDYRTKGLLEILDKQTPDNPVILHEWTGHIVLVNSAALKAAGFDKNTPNPFAGVIDRDASGNPNGVLHDKALGLVYAKKTPWPADVIKQQAKWIFDKVNSYGVVNVGLAQLDPSRLAAYRALEKQGDLTVRLKGHWDWNTRYVTASMEEQAKTFMTPEKRGPKSALIDVDGVKIYADGVASGHAAPYVEPYEDELTVGEQAIDEPTLTTWMLRFDAAGLQVMTHSFGDMSMRHWINAMEATRKHNGNSGIRHIVEHACNTHPDDLPRLAALQDVIVDISPYQLWIPDPSTASWFKLLGYDRMNQTYGIIGSWVRNGITVSYGSDWDNVPEPDPWLAMEGMVTRKAPGHPEYGRFNPDERIDIETAIRIFTINGAINIMKEDVTGSIETGKSADFIVINQNLLEIPSEKIHETKVLQTVLQGKTVYEGK